MNAPQDPQLGEPVIDTALLRLLLEADGPLTVQALALQRGTDRSHVMRELDRLRVAGCAFQENPRQGVRLAGTGLGCWADYLRAVSVKPRLIEVYQQTASTQDTARRLIADRGPAADGALVIADEQTAGRGRLGRRWIAPKGSALTFSRIGRTTTPDDSQAVNRLTFAACVGVAEAIDTWLAPKGQRAQIKWPNDVLVAGRKIAGILVEVVHNGSANHYAIIGVGLNVNLMPKQLPDDPDDPTLRDRVTSLAILGAKADRLAVMARVMTQTDAALDLDDPAELLNRWRRRSTLIGQRVRLQSGGQFYEGEVADLDPNLGLILRTSAGSLVHLPAATTTVL